MTDSLGNFDNFKNLSPKLQYLKLSISFPMRDKICRSRIIVRHKRHGGKDNRRKRKRKQSRWHTTINATDGWTGPNGVPPTDSTRADPTGDKWVMITRRPRPRVALVKLTLLRGSVSFSSLPTSRFLVSLRVVSICLFPSFSRVILSVYWIVPHALKC